MIRMTMGIESREQKTVKCCIAGKSFRKCHMPFWNKLLSDTKLKYEVSDSLIFFLTSAPRPSPFVAARLTPCLHQHQAVPGIRFPDVVNHFL